MEGGPARGEKLIIYNRGTGGDQWVKKSEWKMRSRGVDGVKNRSEQWEGPGGGGGARRVHYAPGTHYY